MIWVILDDLKGLGYMYFGRKHLLPKNHIYWHDIRNTDIRCDNNIVWYQPWRTFDVGVYICIYIHMHVTGGELGCDVEPEVSLDIEDEVAYDYNTATSLWDDVRIWHHRSEASSTSSRGEWRSPRHIPRLRSHMRQNNTSVNALWLLS